MNTKQMIAVMQAHANGEKIEEMDRFAVGGWRPFQGTWNWAYLTFRIAPEPKKEGRWERVEIILTGDSLYMFRCLHHDNVLVSLPNAARYPGFGGVDYRSPSDEKVIIRSTVPVMFKSGAQNYVTSGDYCDEEIMIFDPADRPGIPVAAWFLREEK